MRHALAIVNERGAGLGALEPILTGLGFDVESVAGTGLGQVDLVAPDLVVTLGSSAGVYETARHPFITPQIALLQERLDDKRPTLGICFGAQLVATALGDTVRPGPTREVGFSELALTEAGRLSPLRHFEGVPVMQWHGDRMGLPAGATLLASSAAYPVEVYAVGGWLLGLQFHPELSTTMAASWLEGDGEYAAGAGYDSARLVEDQRSGRFERMREATARMLEEWLGAGD
ncbi:MULTISPECIES: glutamine amidotransferase-related protein [unclassified Rathayibacter]|uniref:glutamine amidotransferase-related protein n=1 Tax=unclassified Rathayibacter TaxID=2609250 RepID=UPI00188C6C91|nr:MULTISPECIES: gamma-glutamyl-gamma-aminobutyrate hydrolase family protein [unclassified Rathayibacter]MBF4463278.1 gamma-glutamyl-gamma-aminobutyrate hydrolase family protein [Rathayibacter sp. VKM Ac-2879]MBF4504485.1 gamma-glutamyl-gamma-aminobutyrate hydrolase family protein [Rathayibacter sp. VKM Ac-2878]